MTSKHTPAPWFQWGSLIKSEEGGWQQKKYICQLSADLTGEQEANAKLIAAAPELLETLKMAKQWLKEFNVCWDSSEGMRISAAINKAEGK